MPNIQHKRGTRAALNTLATGNNLLVGQIYIITDESRIAVALTAGSYQAFQKENEDVSDTITTTNVSLVAGVRKQLPPTPVANRKSIIVTNNSTSDVWYGDSGVTVGTGTLLKAGEKNALSLSSGLYAVCASAITLQVNELS